MALDTIKTDEDEIAEWADALGYDNDDTAWLYYEASEEWVPNPHYRGLAVPHPEDNSEDNDGYSIETLASANRYLYTYD